MWYYILHISVKFHICRHSHGMLDSKNMKTNYRDDVKDRSEDQTTLHDVSRWCSGWDVGLETFMSLVQVPLISLLGYFWDRWPSLVGKLSWDVTTTEVNSPVHPFRVAKSSTSFGWGKGGKVTAAGWQVTLCDPIWHVISCSGVAVSIAKCYIRVYFTLWQTQQLFITRSNTTDLS